MFSKKREYLLRRAISGDIYEQAFVRMAAGFFCNYTRPLERFVIDLRRVISIRDVVELILYTFFLRIGGKLD